MSASTSPAPRFPGRSLSLFFPMFNEEANVEESVKTALAVLPGLVADFEIIVVDDGSKDATGARAEALAAADARVRVVRHPVNRGYGAALRSGFTAARRELVFFTDGDLQFDLAELALLLEQLGDADGVFGYRITRRDPAHRRLNAFLWNSLVRLVLGLRVRDVNCAFKLLKKSALERAGPLEAEGALLSAELIYRLQQSGARLREIGVHHYPRTRGTQTGARPGVIVKAFRELLALRRRLRARRS